ncbi:MAG: peptidyl-prolyl cis-trans isomerase [Chthoniobacterales bacterium]
MINLMRKNQRWLMILISVIVIVAFVFLYNKTDLDKLGRSAMGSIYGRTVSGSEFARSEKQFEIARGLGLYDLLQVLVTGGSRDQAEDYVWSTLVLRKKAEVLQVEPTTEAVAQKIQQLPPFQTNGQFDFEKYQGFVANALTPRGFSEEQLNDLIRDELRLAKLREIVGSATVTSESEVRDAYGNAFRKRHLQVAKLKRETFESAVTVTPAEIKDYYEKNKASFQTDEKRAVKYVVFQLSDADKKLKGKDRVSALQPISNQADAFSQRLLKAGANFDAIAKELNAPVKETATFPASTPPPEIASVTQVAPTIFSLTTDTPDSDVLQTEDGFYIFHLAKIEPAVPQTLEEATAKITSTIREERVAAAMTQKAAELQKAIRVALKSGQTFAQAAAASGLEVESVPAFSPAELQQNREFNADRMIQMRAATLGEGAVSDLIPTMDGGAIAYLEKMEPLDEEKWKTERESMLDQYFSSRRAMSFSEWFRAQRAAANIRTGANAG